MIRSELTGKTFGELYVLGFSEVSRNGHSRWHVTCSCGTNKTVLGTHLIQGKVISCGCIMRQSGARNWKGGKFISGHYYSHVKNGANGSRGRRSIEFDVSLKFLDDLFEKQNGKCKLSGLPIDFRSKTASLDRIDSSKGYTEDNVQWVHKDINMMKRHYTNEYFKFLCKEVVDLV